MVDLQLTENKEQPPMLIDTVSRLGNPPECLIFPAPETPDCGSRTTSEQGKIPFSDPTAKEPS
jgi:hypothetical protein